jgi:serine/threonine-protein kinase
MAEVLAPDDLIEVEPSDGGSAPLTGGTRLGRYELLLPVAKGGMARVWAARQHGQRGFTKLVAIKTILPHLAQDPEFEKMFLDEARIAAGVHHPNVCEIYELAEEGKTLYMAMEWVPGDSFARVLKASGKLVAIDPRVAARIVADACAGLHAAHNLTDDDGKPLNVVHRDVSPHNILVSADGVVKVADFGVAKALNQLHNQTSAGQLKGKIAYMAPEQVTGGHIDRRSDLFSLGCVLYESTTGVQPFKGDGDHQVMHKLLQGQFAKPSEIVRGYPEELEQIVLRAMALQPLQRFPNADRMKNAIEEWLVRSGPIVGHAQVAQVVRARIGAALDKRKERIRMAMAAPAPVPANATSEPPGMGHTPSNQGRSGVQPSGYVHSAPPSVRHAPPAPSTLRGPPQMPQAPPVRDFMQTVRLGEGPPVPPPRMPSKPPPPLPAGLVPTGAGPRAEPSLPPTVTTAFQLPLGPADPTPAPHGVAPIGEPASQPISGPVSDPTSGPMSHPFPRPTPEQTDVTVPSSVPPPRPMQYVLAAAIGIAVASLIGVAAFFIVRAARQPAPEPMATTRPAAPVASAPVAAPSVSASAAASAVASAAARAAETEGDIVFRVFPEQAVLVVDGTPLAKDARAVSRPKAGQKTEVVVRAEGFREQSFSLEDTTTSPIDVWLVEGTEPAASATVQTPPKATGGGGTGGARRSDPIPANPY